MPKSHENCDTPEELRRVREKRVMDAVRLKVPDRVPVCTPIGYFAAKYTGIPCSAAYYDFDAWYAAYKNTLSDFQADMVFIQPFTPGRVLEILHPKAIRWPGFNTDPRFGHQAVEIDNMKADEYEAFINDPSDYMFSRLQPPSAAGPQKTRLFCNLHQGQRRFFVNEAQYIMKRHTSRGGKIGVFRVNQR